MSNVGHHALFVDSFNPTTLEITCLNSWGPNNDPNPKLALSTIQRVYRVSCSAQKISSPVPAPSQKQHQVVQNTTTTQSNSKTSPGTQPSNAPPGTQPSLSPRVSSDSSDDGDDDDTKDSVLECEDDDLLHLDTFLNNWEKADYKPTLEEVKRAARLACGGHLSKVKHMRLRDIAIDSIPKAALGKLSAAVTDEIFIDNVVGDLKPIFFNMKATKLNIMNSSNIMSSTVPKKIQAKEIHLKKVKGKDKDDLSSLFKSFECSKLFLFNVTLGHEETKVLVQLLQDHVERLVLGTSVSMILSTFLKYDGSGSGACKSIQLRGGTIEKYWQNEFKSWSEQYNFKADQSATRLSLNKLE